MPKYSEPLVGSLYDVPPFELTATLTQAQQAISLVSARLSAESGLHLLLVEPAQAARTLQHLKDTAALSKPPCTPMRRWLPVDRSVCENTVYSDSIVAAHAEFIRALLHLRLNRSLTTSNRLVVATSALALMHEHMPTLGEVTTRLLNADWRAALVTEHRLRRPVRSRRDYAIRAAYLGTAVADQIEAHPIPGLHSSASITNLTRRSHRS
ncbi:hypothetical protein CH254_04805 [Rhodococcus sp. 06-412-2C]|uniref:hypothetical protein n=1 Tax=unclassified Rhodococcus (in: high G+C Gram-positive bacteria) TaxID=192944 RepID=UPI000B9B54D7|nr:MULTISPECIES: hypothetical protein [unclassified Rhodococcus (in: high G+C Gram-positive bacteria)]OZC91801.1 hypothetical protein CH254_04805 [Rhodococcus sp. 06-412-2C]OZC92370.1 hypothetical protein CH279_26085 [Rhodococcus sp. 06-412-2B]